MCKQTIICRNNLSLFIIRKLRNKPTCLNGAKRKETARDYYRQRLHQYIFCFQDLKFFQMMNEL